MEPSSVLYGKTVLITGASSGIGLATAYAFANAGSNLILLSRNISRLEEIKEHIYSTSPGIKIHTALCDVRNAQLVSAVINEIPESFKAIDILINNAGLARGIDKIQDGFVEDWDEMIDTNVKGVLYITHAVLPLMISKQQGHIITISSGAGRDVYVGGNVYNATKFAIEGLSKAMRMDLLEQHIKVSVIAPGMVDTNFHTMRCKNDPEKGRSRLDGYEPLTAKDVADSILYCATVPDHVNISELVITPKAQAGTMIYKDM